MFGGVVAVAVRLYARMLAGAADRGVVNPTTAAGVLGGGCSLVRSTVSRYLLEYRAGQVRVVDRRRGGGCQAGSRNADVRVHGARKRTPVLVLLL